MKEQNMNEQEKSNLEKKFEQEYENFSKLIKEKLELSEQYLNEALELSEKYGIPFRSKISHLRDMYIPESFQETWDNENIQEYIKEITATYYGEQGEYGWQQSRRC